MDVREEETTSSQRQPGPPPPADPGPEGPEGERVGEDEIDEDAVTVRTPAMKPEPATPDANPIDPRVFRGK